MSRREQRADSRAIARMLLPRAIVVMGATDRPGSGGRRRMAQRQLGRVPCPLSAVNRNRTRIGEHAGPTPASPTSPTSSRWLSLAVPATNRSPRRSTSASPCRSAGVVLRRLSIDGTDLDLDAIVAGRATTGCGIIGPSSMGAAVVPCRRSASHASLLPERLPSRAAWRSRCSPARSAPRFSRLAEQQALGLSWFVSLGDRADVSGNRPAAVLRGRRVDTGDRHVHRGFRRPATVRPHRQAGTTAPANRRGENRTRC